MSAPSLLQLDIVYKSIYQNYGTFRASTFRKKASDSAVTRMAESAIPPASEDQGSAAGAPVIANHQVTILKKKDNGVKTPLLQGACKTDGVKNKKNEKAG